MSAYDQLNRKQAIAVSHYAGFRGKNLVKAVAIMGAESGRKYLAFYDGNSNGSTDRGLYQINNFAHPDFSDHDAFLPILNAKYAYKMSGGKHFTAWASYNSGRYLVNLASIGASLVAAKAGLWKESIADREAVFDRVGDGWIPNAKG